MRTGPPGRLTSGERVKMADRRQALSNLDTRRERTHNRSASWSFTRRSGSTNDLGSLLTGSGSAMMGILREVLPVSFSEPTGEDNNTVSPSVPRSRGRTTLGQSVVGLPSRVAATITPTTPSRSGSLNLISERVQEDRGTEVGVAEEEWHEPPPPVLQGINHTHEGEVPEGENSDEVIHWLEQHALFVVIILVKIGWSYKFGKFCLCVPIYVHL